MIKIWRSINNINFKKPRDLIKYLKKKNFITSIWIDDIFYKRNISLNKIKLPLDLYRISLKSLGFKKPAKLKEVYQKEKKKGF